MKTKKAAHLSFLIGLVSMSLTGTACGAAPNNASTPAPTFTMTGNTPELDRADERVRQADAQLNIAKKQLRAAQQLLKAAEADLRASKAERESLAIKAQAQNLADEAGMTPSVAPPVGNEPKAIAVAQPKNATKAEKKPLIASPVTTAPVVSTPVTESAPTELKPIHNVDFNVEPLNTDETAAPAAAPVLR